MNLAIAGGGTGGHLFPGLVVARLAIERSAARSVVFFGARRGMEARIVPHAGFDLVAEDLVAVAGEGPARQAVALARLARASLRMRVELQRREVDVLVGLGGYASTAGALGARLARVPIVLLEQNLEPGLANRLAARLAVTVCTSFEQSSRFFPARRCQYTGNPVRPELERLGVKRQRDTLLILGGSRGAVSLNRVMVSVLRRLGDELRLPRILHQAGRAGLAELRAAYREAGIDAEVVAFVDDMASAYGRAMLALCRAGATTLAELVASATPAVLLPYPYARRDHQRRNAQVLAQAGAALIVGDDAATCDRLCEVLRGLLRRPERLDSMMAHAASLRRPGAAGRVVDVLQGVVQRNQ